MAVETKAADLTVLRPILRMWNKNASANLDLQTILKNRGFYKGNTDGDYGPLTFKAVTAFQLASNLTANGVCGPKTWDALLKPSASPEPPVAPTLPVPGLPHDGGSPMSAITTFKSKAPTYMGFLMQDFGFDVLDAAAIMGNAGHESGGLSIMQEKNPTVTGSRGGFGWFQWTGPRRKAFEAYCSRSGLNSTSDGANYGFLFVELRGPEKKAIARTKAAKGLTAKVKAFENAFERAGIKHYASRNTWANRALDAWNVSGKLVPTPALQPQFEVPVVTPVPTPQPPPPLPQTDVSVVTPASPKPRPKPVDSAAGAGAAASGAAAGGTVMAAGFDPWLAVFVAVAVGIAALIIIRAIRD